MSEPGDQSSISDAELKAIALNVWKYGNATTRVIAGTPLVLSIWWAAVLPFAPIPDAWMEHLSAVVDPSERVNFFLLAFGWMLVVRACVLLFGKRFLWLDWSLHLEMTDVEHRVRHWLRAVVWGGASMYVAISSASDAVTNGAAIWQVCLTFFLGALGGLVSIAWPLNYIALLFIIVGTGFRVRPVCDREHL